MQTLPEVLLSFKFVWKAKSKKKSSLRWVGKYFHKKMHRKRETFVGFFRETCQKLSRYEIDHECLEEIFLEQLFRDVLVISAPLTLAYLCWMIQFVSYLFICLRLWNGLKVTKWINNIANFDKIDEKYFCYIFFIKIDNTISSRSVTYCRDFLIDGQCISTFCFETF